MTTAEIFKVIATYYEIGGGAVMTVDPGFFKFWAGNVSIEVEPRKATFTRMLEGESIYRVFDIDDPKECTWLMGIVYEHLRHADRDITWNPCDLDALFLHSNGRSVIIRDYDVQTESWDPGCTTTKVYQH